MEGIQQMEYPTLLGDDNIYHLGTYVALSGLGLAVIIILPLSIFTLYGLIRYRHHEMLRVRKMISLLVLFTLHTILTLIIIPLLQIHSILWMFEFMDLFIPCIVMMLLLDIFVIVGFIHSLILYTKVKKAGK